MGESYQDFIENKTHLANGGGFEPTFIPDYLLDFQKHLTTWAIRQGRAGLFEDCGLGKTVQSLVWAENVCRHTNGRVMLMTPLAVGAQTIREAHKFNIDGVEKGVEGEALGKITVVNYEQLHKYNPSDFVGAICDESGILKNFDGTRKGEITAFMRKMPYRLLCTATAAPNDYVELGTSSEALGNLGYMDMLNRFFKKLDNNGAKDFRGNQTRAREHQGGVYRFRGHAERDFWRWVCSWSRAIRKPSDYGFDDSTMVLPPLNITEHTVRAKKPPEGMLFNMPARGMSEQRDEVKRTIEERCDIAAGIANSHGKQVIAWCHRNEEGKLLKKLIEGAVEVSGSDTDEFKEEVFSKFADGQIRALVTKPKIAGFGMNFQNCSEQIYFPSFSYEQYYQAVRRSWRFGQKHTVNVNMIYTDGQEDMMKSLQRKSYQADKLFQELVAMMANELRIQRQNDYTKQVEAPGWL